MYIVIPCHNEPDLLTTFNSLLQCTLPDESVKVLAIINHSETADEKVVHQNQLTLSNTTAWIKQYSTPQLSFEAQLHILPKKHAGVGLARRIGMDIAADYYLKVDNPNGVIVCFDADCTVESNYLVEIEKHFATHPTTPAASIYFEHDLEKCKTEENRVAILNYELFLRYYIEGLKYAAYPYAFHTIGSSMAVRAGIYKKQGGMNQRKAGEDFYFLHKIMPLGGFTEINTTTVYPSSRASNRVPFGTGKAVNDWYNKTEKVFETYNPKVFNDLHVVMNAIKEVTKDYSYISWVDTLPNTVKQFLAEHEGEKGWNNAYNNSASNESFSNRWLNWWDGFKVLKFVHFVRDRFYPNIPLQEAVLTLLIENKKAANDTSLHGFLIHCRDIQRSLRLLI